MKKKLLTPIFFIFIFIFLFSLEKDARAGIADCTNPVGSIVITTNRCRENGYDCDKKVAVVSKKDCNNQDGCYEETNSGIKWCYLKKEAPEPTPVIKNKLNILCDSNSGPNSGIKTAIGCFPVLSTTNDFLSAVLKWAVGIGGGIAFILMLYAGFMIMTASGNPERLKAGQELLTSAIAGLILLVFSIFILKLIGVDILGLEQFGFNQ